MLVTEYKDFIEKNEEVLFEQACVIVIGTYKGAKTLIFLSIAGYKKLKHKDN